tara:strand:+ start:2168 stop:2962 length:795 start_codon:yes stop_codon:yes gene_type:complete
MADTFTMDESDINIPDLNPDEQDSLAVGQELEAAHDGLLAGKYSSATELESAYLELQKKLGTANTEETVAEPVEQEVAEDESESVATSFLNNASSEYAENGTISEETMAVLKDMSSEELVAAYIEMQGNAPESAPEPEVDAGPDLNDRQIIDIQNSVGGEAQYNELLSWASQNLGEKEIEAFDEVVDSGNAQSIKFAIAGIKSMYEAAVGSEGVMLTGKAPSPNGNSFRSQAEVVKAMSDTRYDSDPAYRAEVERLLANSPNLF